MRLRTALLVCLALALARAPWVSAQQQIQFFATFTGAGGDPVTTTTLQDLEVREDDRAGTVVSLEPADWPAHVELLLDNGSGIGSDNLATLRSGLRGFLEALPDGVEVSVITTAPQPRTLVRPGTDRAQWMKGEGILTPDAGAGRFFDALRESAARVDRTHGDTAGGHYFPVVVALGSTAAAGGTPVDRNVQEMLMRFGEHAATVHVIMLNSATGASANTGANQAQIGRAVAELTGGRYEEIAVPGRIASLLPELGARVAASDARQRRQYRITVQRPAGASGPLGQVTVRTRNGTSAQLSLDGHLP